MRDTGRRGLHTLGCSWLARTEKRGVHWMITPSYSSDPEGLWLLSFLEFGID